MNQPPYQQDPLRPIQQQEYPPQGYTGQPMAQYPPMPPQYVQSQQLAPQQIPVQQSMQGYPGYFPQQGYQQLGYPPQPMPGYGPQPYLQQPYPPMPPQQIIINNQMTQVSGGKQSPSMLIRVLWFCLIGWWAGFVWVGVALSLCTTFIGLPVGILMLVKTGKVFFL
jgi:hypothetical protein